MGGKGGGPLSIWIKEFCQLVLLQTVQAMIYAIILSIVVEIMAAANANTYSTTSGADYNASIGLMCIFAFLSVFKVEDLIKSIIGFDKTKADHGSAMKSIAKTGIALKLGSKVLNNAGKIGSGAMKLGSNLAQGRKDRLSEAKKKQLIDDEFGVSAGGDGGTSALSTQDRAKYEQKVMALRDESQRKRSERRSQNMAAVKQISSGTVESVGAAYGGVAGGIIGVADGNIEEGLQGVLAGAGLGDAAGKLVNDTAFLGPEVAMGAANALRGTSKRKAFEASSGEGERLRNEIDKYKEKIKERNFTNINNDNIDFAKAKLKEYKQKYAETQRKWYSGR